MGKKRGKKPTSGNREDTQQQAPSETLTSQVQSTSSSTQSSTSTMDRSSEPRQSFVESPHPIPPSQRRDKGRGKKLESHQHPRSQEIHGTKQKGQDLSFIASQQPSQGPSGSQRVGFGRGNPFPALSQPSQAFSGSQGEGFGRGNPFPALSQSRQGPSGSQGVGFGRRNPFPALSQSRQGPSGSQGVQQGQILEKSTDKRRYSSKSEMDDQENRGSSTEKSYQGAKPKEQEVSLGTYQKKMKSSDKELQKEQTKLEGPKQKKQGPSEIEQEVSQKKLVAELSKMSVSSGSSTSKLPKRKNPFHGGVLGRPIRVLSNHFDVDLSKLKIKDVWHYDVDIVPDKPKSFLKLAVEEMRKKHFPRNYPAFDGKKNLYAAGQLPFNIEIFDTVTIIDDRDRKKEYKVTIKETKEIIDFEILKYSPKELYENDNLLVKMKPAITALDIILRTVPSATFTQVGRSFFAPPRQIIKLGDGMEMWYGFYQSVISGWKVLLNVDVANKAFPIHQNLIKAYDELSGKYFSDRDLQKFFKFAKGIKIEYTIPGYPQSKKTYIINGMASPARIEKFQLENKQVISIEDYFKKYKNIKLDFPTNYPCIRVGDQKRPNPIILPMELCTIVKGQVLNRKMNDIQTSKMIKEAATTTEIRKNKIMEGMRSINYYKNHPCVDEFGISIGQKFQELSARILDPPKLAYGNQGSIMPSSGSWRMRDEFINPCGNIDKWGVLNLVAGQRGVHPQSIAKMILLLTKLGSNKGLHFNPKPFIEQRDKFNIKEFFDRCKNDKYRIIIVIIPDRGDTYGKVKQVAELKTGIVTQCIRQRTIDRITDATITNILLKINSKLNGSNHHLKKRPKCLEEPVMLIGADVAHPSPDSKDIPSVAAVAASHDPNGYCYNIQYRLQPPTREIIDDLSEIIKSQLINFFKKTRQKPFKIIYYRDGVSEGQFEEILRMELIAIRKACTSLEAAYNPKITFIIVQKRHHTRLFPADLRDCKGDKWQNVPAGTIVDTEITHPTDIDFYLVSHSSLQGVTRPTKYRILHDDSDFTDDEIQELTFSLCHLFSRCTRSVSYPTPTYYAHLAAARARIYLEGSHINLDRLESEQRNREIKDEVIKNHPMFFV